MSRLSIDTDGKAYCRRDLSDERELGIEYNISYWPKVESIFDFYHEIFDEYDPPRPWAEVVVIIAESLRDDHPEIFANPDALLTIYYQTSTGKLSF